MNWPSWILWGFISTLLMTTMEAAAEALHLTRIDLAFMIGTIFTPDRDRAKIYGFLSHTLNGWGFSLLYVLTFESLHRATWWLGIFIGAVHALFVLLVVMSMLPAIHPRMASEQSGPTASRQLEPPGWFGLHYGVRTPISIFLSHMVFGAVLGAFYQLSSMPHR